MITAMILAHLVGDYILQWNGLAAWKAREMKGVFFHTLIVTAVTLLSAAIINPAWWPWALFICLMHLLIDAFGLRVSLPWPPLGKFFADQAAHFLVILGALFLGGYLDLSAVTTAVAGQNFNETWQLYLIGYAFVTMPAWVLVKFTAYGLIQGSAPEFGDNSKYLGIFERILIVTFVALGQFFLVPLVLLPRFLAEWPRVVQAEQGAVYLAELLASTIVAVAIGLIFWLL